jgi:cytochrome c oxidase subunit 2
MERPMHFPWRRLAALAFLAPVGALPARPALAQQPVPWEMGMQPAFSPVKAQIISLHNLVMVIITLITIFVAALLVYASFRFSAKRNPVASRTSHNTVLEIAWTTIPVLILVIIAIPSFRLVYYEDRAVDPDMTLKVTGHQWYWHYAYPDAGGLQFDSYIVDDKDLKEGQPRLLTVDNQVVLPVGKKIRILTTSADVIHSFFIPSLGVQRYAIPGHTIETWVQITQPGDYYGECNQICGTNHSRMPISIHAVPPAEFTAWLASAKTKFAMNPPAAQPTQFAQALPAPASPLQR